MKGFNTIDWMCCLMKERKNMLLEEERIQITRIIWIKDCESDYLLNWNLGLNKRCLLIDKISSKLICF